MFRLFGLFLVIQGLLSLQDDYYWREYTGKIPEDAVVGGQDINGENIYIGQGFLENGLIVAAILSGKREVLAPMFGVKKISNHIKILCGDQENFFWMPCNSSHLHLQMINKRPVIGGHEKEGVLFVGRINEGGETKIGKIVSFSVGKADLFYVSNEKEKSADLYEVLLYNGTSNTNTDVEIKS